MSRTSRVRALVLTALLGAAGCQDYNFNPVGECLIQPGTRRVELSGVTTADVLFVVDDSGSMKSEQQALADNFEAFIDSLKQANLARINADPPQVPIDFHLAITTTSVFENLPDPSTPTCRSDCPNPAGGTMSGTICCQTNGTTPVAPFYAVKKCNQGDTCTAGVCRNDCVGYLGEYVCCDSESGPVFSEPITCTAEDENAPCGALSTHYRLSNSPACMPFNGKPYPAGSFLASGTNPKVLHFDKDIYQANSNGHTCAAGSCPNKQGYLVGPGTGTLIDFFTSNVKVGLCGSNEEQPLEAAQRAVDYWLKQPEPTREWLHKDSKLVLVFVADEDDCSTPEDPSRGVILSYDPAHPLMPAWDSCIAEQQKTSGQKLNSVQKYVDYFTSARPNLPVGAAFIVSAKAGDSNVCVDNACTAAVCSATCSSGDTPQTCGGQSPGFRLLQAARDLQGDSADVVAGSICDDHFGTILQRIAEIVKPPSGLLLPSEPADEEVTLLRIAGGDGKTRKTCRGPAPAGVTATQAAADGYDWWFTKTREQVTDDQKQPWTVSRYVYINHDTRNCEANPGETYAADYIGRLPANGCTGATAQEADDNCVAMLGGKSGEWTCYAGTDTEDRCIAPTGDPAAPFVGTCLCGPRYVAPSSAGQPAGGLCPKGCTPGSAEYCPDPAE